MISFNAGILVPTSTETALPVVIDAQYSYTSNFLEVTFTDESTGPVTNWSWDFGDTNSSTSQNPVHTFASAGDYTVTLTASDGAGTDDITSQVITVTEEELPLGDVTVSSTSTGSCDIDLANPCTATTDFVCSAPANSVGNVTYVWSAEFQLGGDTTGIIVTPSGNTCSVSTTTTNVTEGVNALEVTCVVSDEGTGDREVSDTLPFYQNIIDSSNPANIDMPTSIIIDHTESVTGGAEVWINFNPDGTIVQEKGVSSELPSTWITGDFVPGDYTLSIANDSRSDLQYDQLGTLDVTRRIGAIHTEDALEVRAVDGVITGPSGSDTTTLTIRIRGVL